MHPGSRAATLALSGWFLLTFFQDPNRTYKF